MTPYRLGYQLQVLLAEILPVAGLLFVNYRQLSLTELETKVAEHESPAVAQQWMNIVLLDHFIREVCGDEWEDDDPGVDQILSVVARSWEYQIKAKYPNATFAIEKMADPEYGDLGLRLLGALQ